LDETALALVAHCASVVSGDELICVLLGAEDNDELSRALALVVVQRLDLQEGWEYVEHAFSNVALGVTPADMDEAQLEALHGCARSVRADA